MAATPRRRWPAPLLLATLGTVLLLAALVAWLNVRDEAGAPPGGAARPPSAEDVARGAYLARAGNCRGCHTAPGGPAYAGGLGVQTPFGVVVAPNITPDPSTGIGSWSPDDFWRALHHGRSRDGRLLYPAFPYPSFTLVTREDADAIHAYLMSVPAVGKANEPHRLRFPYGTQAALAVWRALYFRASRFEAEAGQGAHWNRGKYLVEGLGHCAACHSGRDALGGPRRDAAWAGGQMPGGSWHAPSLASPDEGGVQRWAPDQVVRLLKDGVSGNAGVSGPMADVVFHATQHLTREDLTAMAGYLASIRIVPVDRPEARPADTEVMAQGETLYAEHCAGCHGRQGQGAAGLYPALAGNRAVTLPAHHNLVQLIRHGGFAPATGGNPRPFGMPPYGPLLDAHEIAAVATFLRQSWGHRAAPVSPLDVLRVP